MAYPAEIAARHFVPHGVLERLVRAPDLAHQGKHVAEVAVLFVDVQNCSVLCEALPPPAMNRLREVALGNFFACVQEAGGDINEIMGDGFMALFEGRPLRESVGAAAHAALVIHRHACAYRRVADLPDTPLVVNIGLHAGSALVGVTRFANRYSERWTYTASGPVTNVAARLCALARHGTILLSGAVARYLAAAYLLRPRGAYYFKNITPRVQVYQLLGPRPAALPP